MNKEIMQKVLDKIEQYDKIVITRHMRPDGDAIGSSKGLRGMLKLTYPQKDIRLINEDYSDYLAFLGGEDEPFADEDYKDALVIVLDTATAERISNKKYSLAKELLKIDHHLDVKPYGDLCWIESWRSSTCEMVACLYSTFKDKLKMDKETATYIYCGMVTDSGRFRYESTTGETLRLASQLLDFGIDTDNMYAHLYLEDFDFLKFQAYVFKKMCISPNGVASLYVDKAMQRKFKLTTEQACESVSFMNSIKGCIAWIAFIEMPDNTIRVRLRSRFMTINKVAERHNGGGHECTCGATLFDKKEVDAVIADADQAVKEYKQSHEGWL
ncbi:MAG: bifunctional oligoribonuclease/PAP phosphatase NrnA [Corallococcus sp.]|nr:bifunctional oligoribonuclease/PAP phosphatase NrnA [Corallococcus sp.]